MRRYLVVVFVLAVIAPIGGLPASAAKSVSVAGSGYSRALDLSVPALNAILSTLPAPDQLKNFKGVTVAETRADFDSSVPTISGMAFATCELIPPLSESIPCSFGPAPKQTVANQATPVSESPESCLSSVDAGILIVESACSSSLSQIQGGSLKGNNRSGIGAIKMSIDLSDLGLPGSIELEEAKDQVVDAVSDVISTVFESLPGTTEVVDEKLENLHEEILRLLEAIKDGGQALVIDLGPATTSVTTEGSVTTVLANGAGGKIGLLGLKDALTDGLVIIEISSGFSKVSFDGDAGAANAEVQNALATIKVRDLIDLDDNPATKYIELSISPTTPDVLHTILGLLNGTPLETVIEDAVAERSVDGRSASASTSGVGVRALVGLGESALGAGDGGIALRIASAQAAISGSIVEPGEQTRFVHPTTGGPTYLYFAGAALIALTGAVVLRRALKIRGGN